MKSSNYQNIAHMESRKRNRNLPVIDEDMLREAVGGQSAEGSMLEIAERIPDALQDLGGGTEDRHGQSVRNRICGKHPPQPSGTLQRGDQPAAQRNKQRRSSVILLCVLVWQSNF